MVTDDGNDDDVDDDDDDDDDDGGVVDVGDDYYDDVVDVDVPSLDQASSLVNVSSNFILSFISGPFWDTVLEMSGCGNVRMSACQGCRNL